VSQLNRTLPRTARADSAATEHGKALNYLKNVAGFVSKGGAAKALASEAALHGLKASDIDTNNASYKSKLQALQTRYQHLEAEADHLGDQVDAMEAEALNHREVAGPNQDPQYKAHLKKCFDDYRTVLAFASNGLATLKRLETNVPKLEQMVNRTEIAGTVHLPCSFTRK
jgi:hypothetical protein